MARDFIKISPTTTNQQQAGLLIQYISTLRQAYQFGALVKGLMDHNQDGTVWVDLEAAFGIPTGKGQTVYNFVNGSTGAMVGTFQNSDCKNITEQVG